MRPSVETATRIAISLTAAVIGADDGAPRVHADKPQPQTHSLPIAKGEVCAMEGKGILSAWTLTPYFNPTTGERGISTTACIPEGTKELVGTIYIPEVSNQFTQK